MIADLTDFVQWILTDFEPSVRATDELDLSDAESDEWASILRSFQDPESGYLIAKTAFLSKVHNTAFSLAAMNLLDVAPAHPLRFARNFDTPEQIQAYVAMRDWATGVYLGGEDVIGLASAFVLVPDTVPASWFTSLMDYFDMNLFDANNGMIGRDKPAGGDLDQIGGTFHLAFLWDHFNRIMPFPEKRIDAILGLQKPNGEWTPDNPWWMTLDSVYMLLKAVPPSDYRRADITNAVTRAVRLSAERISDNAARRAVFGQELGVHLLNAVLSLFAVVQEHLGQDEIVTPKPLRLVLNKRPYI